MAKKSFTPEEQLLNLIERGGEPETVRFKRKRGFLLGLEGLKISWLSFWKRFFQGFVRTKGTARELNLKTINKLCLVISLVLLIYSVVEFVFGRADMESFFEKAKTYRETEPQLVALIEERPFLHHLEMVRRRNIFTPVVIKEPVKPEETKKKLQEMIQPFSLVGISWEEEPLAMVEDKSDNKTYFLKKGDTLGPLKVEDVLPDRVILGYAGETIELM